MTADKDKIEPGMPQPVVGDLTAVCVNGVVVKVEPLNLNDFPTSFSPHTKIIWPWLALFQ